MRWKGKRDDIAFLNGDNDVSQLGLPMNEFQDLVSSLASLGEDSDLQKMFDADKDGKLDSGKEITKRIKDKYAGEIGSDNPNTPTLGEKLNELKGKAATARDSFPQEVRDGVLDANELDALKRGPITFETLDKITKPGIRVDGDVNQLVKAATYNHLKGTVPYVFDVLNDIMSPSGGFRGTSKERVNGDLVNIQTVISQLQNANVPEKGKEVAARLLNQLNDWADIVKKASGEFSAQDAAVAKKAEEDRVAAEEKAKQDKASFDAQLTNRVAAGLRDPIGAVKDVGSNITGGIAKALKKKVKF